MHVTCWKALNVGIKNVSHSNFSFKIWFRLRRWDDIRLYQFAEKVLRLEVKLRDIKVAAEVR